MLDKLIHDAVTTFPKLASVPIAIVPFELYRSPLQSFLQSVFKNQLVDGEFDFLEGRWLQVNVSDLGWAFCISVSDGCLVLQAPGRETDVQFAGSGDDLLLVAARKQDPDTLFFQRRLMISGDTELGLAIKNLMDAVEWDQLPKPLGWALNSSATIISRAQAYPSAV